MFAYTGGYGKLVALALSQMPQPMPQKETKKVTLSEHWNTELPRVPVIMLVLDFHLHGCQSLKEKRTRLHGLRQRFGKSTAVAVAECGHQNEHGRAQWSFVATAADSRVAQRALQEIEDYAAQSVDAELIAVRLFELN